MRKVCFSPTISIKLLAVFIISICMLSVASATLITGSEGSVDIIGTGAGGSLKVNVDYAIYDGTSGSDPLGTTSDYQIQFILTHLGTGGANPVLNFGRFTVFAPDVFSTVPFYTGIDAVGTGKSPYDFDWAWAYEQGYHCGYYDLDGTVDGMYLELPSGGYGSNNAQFIFVDDNSMATFATGQTSMQLVVTVSPADLPNSVILEIDHTDAGVHGDAYVEFVPEPASVTLFGAAFYLLSLRRRHKK